MDISQNVLAFSEYMIFISLSQLKIVQNTVFKTVQVVSVLRTFQAFNYLCFFFSFIYMIGFFFAFHNSEGWCLQFNQHLEKTLLVPVAAEPKQVLQKTSSETGNRGTPPVASAVGGAGGGMQGNLLKGIDNKIVKVSMSYERP